MNTTHLLSKHPKVAASSRRMSELVKACPSKNPNLCNADELARYATLDAHRLAHKSLCADLKRQGWRAV